VRQQSLDNTQSFMKASHPPIPFAQQGLVALEFLSAASPRRIGVPKGILRWRSGVRHPGAPALHSPATTPCSRLVERA
jgi:hypothetical protein